MARSDTKTNVALAQSRAALQREPQIGAAPVAAKRPRGPHPLPLFLQLAREACGDDHARLAQVLAGLRAYQTHPYVRASDPAPVLAQVGAVTLRDYASQNTRMPAVVFVPSLINPPTVLDLAEGNSLLRWLAKQGLRPLLIDWGHPGPAEMALGLDGMISERLLPLLRQAPQPCALAGYCLGGTMALAAATLFPVTRLALLATPWHFSGFAADQLAATATLWQQAGPLAAALGAMPMDLLQPLFWQLDPGAPAAKFVRFAGLAADSAEAHAFVALEDWANDGPPLPLRVAQTLFEDFFAGDLTGRGGWQVGGRSIDPRALAMPVLDMVSTRDRIVPAASSVAVGTRRDLDLGHVGMVVGSRGRTQVWEPLAAWLRDG